MKNPLSSLFRFVLQFRHSRRAKVEERIPSEQLRDALMAMFRDPQICRLILKDLPVGFPVSGGTLTPAEDVEAGTLGTSQGAPTPRSYVFSADAATTTPLTVQGADSQTHPLQQWKDSSGNVLAAIQPGGNVGVGGTLGVGATGKKQSFTIVVPNNGTDSYTPVVFYMASAGSPTANQGGNVRGTLTVGVSGSQTAFQGGFGPYYGSEFELFVDLACWSSKPNVAIFKSYGLDGRGLGKAYFSHTNGIFILWMYPGEYYATWDGQFEVAYATATSGVQYYDNGSVQTAQMLAYVDRDRVFDSNLAYYAVTGGHILGAGTLGVGATGKKQSFIVTVPNNQSDSYTPVVFYSVAAGSPTASQGGNVRGTLTVGVSGSETAFQGGFGPYYGSQFELFVDLACWSSKPNVAIFRSYGVYGRGLGKAYFSATNGVFILWMYPGEYYASWDGQFELAYATGTTGVDYSDAGSTETALMLSHDSPGRDTTFENRLAYYAVTGGQIVTPGSVGIGTTSPQARLNVRGSAPFTASGTVSVTHDSETVTGSGTSLNSQVHVGDRVSVTINGTTVVRTVTAVNSDTSLSVDDPYVQTASGLTMTVSPSMFRADDSSANPQFAVTGDGHLVVGRKVASASQPLSGFVGLAGTAINDDDSVGYVVCNADVPFIDKNNEMRGYDGVLRYTRNTPDASIGGEGWDVRPFTGAVSLESMNLPSGVVSTNGTAVTWVSGRDFGWAKPGLRMPINGGDYVIASVASNTSLTLQTSAGIQNNVPYGDTSIHGSMMPFTSELYFTPPAPGAPAYSVRDALNYVAALAEMAPSCSVPFRFHWAGFFCGPVNNNISGWVHDSTVFEDQLVIPTSISTGKYGDQPDHRNYVNHSGSGYIWAATFPGGGSSGATGHYEPSWPANPTVGTTTVVDNEVTWLCYAAITTPMHNVDAGYGLWVASFDDAPQTLNQEKSASIKIDSFDNLGRILWDHASISEKSDGSGAYSGILQLFGYTRVEVLGNVSGELRCGYATLAEAVPQPGIPPAGYGALYFKSDHQLYYKQSGGAEIGPLLQLAGGTGISISPSNGVATIAATGGTGTVTSVGLSMPAIFSVSGSPVTGAGTLSASLAAQGVNQVFAGPASGGAATPGFRALVAGDIPGIPASKINDTVSANQVFASPNGSSGAAAFRGLVAADLPSAMLSGPGSSPHIAKYVGSSTLADSLMTDDGTAVTISGNFLPSGTRNIGSTYTPFSQVWAENLEGHEVDLYWQLGGSYSAWKICFDGSHSVLEVLNDAGTLAQTWDFVNGASDLNLHVWPNSASTFDLGRAGAHWLHLWVDHVGNAVEFDAAPVFAAGLDCSNQGAIVGSLSVPGSGHTIIDSDRNISTDGYCNAAAYKVGGANGFSGTVGNPTTITVVNGIVTSVA